MSIVIAAERPDSTDAAGLIAELNAYLERLSPPESRHGLSIEQLLARDVAFFVLRVDDTPAGCAGIQLCGPAYGEVKRMYVRPPYRGRGFARMLLARLADHAPAYGVGALRLETGIAQRDAISMYERAGFRRIPPFGSYRDDPLSLFYEMLLPPV